MCFPAIVIGLLAIFVHHAPLAERYSLAQKPLLVPGNIVRP